MAVITFLSGKGGSGKSTTALTLVTELAKFGAEVCVIDADPMRWITRWSKLQNKPSNVSVVSDADQTNIVDRIEDVSAKYPFVIIDLEGTANVTASYAVAMSDLVLIPCQGSALDAEAAGEAVAMVQTQAKVARRSIPHSVVLTRTSAAVMSRSLRATREQLNEAMVDVMPVAMVERAAFRELFAFGGGLADLDPKEVNGLDKARQNGRELAQSVLTKLKEFKNG